MRSLSNSDDRLMRRNKISSISSNYIGLVLMCLGIAIFSILCISLATDFIPSMASLVILLALILPAIFFRERFNLDWVVFAKDSLWIRSSHGFIEIERNEIQNIDVRRSLDDEESVFTPAYKLLFTIHPRSALIQKLFDSGFEIASGESGTILVFRVSGVTQSMTDLNRLVVDWMCVKGRASNHTFPDK